MLIRPMRAYLRPYRGLLTVLVVLQLVGTIASLYLPSLNGRIIDEGVAKGDTGYILRTGVWMLAVSLVQIAATVGATYLGARSAAGLGRDLRADVFARVGDFSAQEVSRFGAPTLISRSTNDVTQVQTGRLHGRRDDGVRPDHDGRRHHHGAARGRRAVLAGRRGRPAPRPVGRRW